MYLRSILWFSLCIFYGGFARSGLNFTITNWRYCIWINGVCFSDRRYEENLKLI